MQLPQYVPSSLNCSVPSAPTSLSILVSFSLPPSPGLLLSHCLSHISIPDSVNPSHSYYIILLFSGKPFLLPLVCTHVSSLSLSHCHVQNTAWFGKLWLVHHKTPSPILVWCSPDTHPAFMFDGRIVKAGLWSLKNWCHNTWSKNGQRKTKMLSSIQEDYGSTVSVYFKSCWKSWEDTSATYYNTSVVVFLNCMILLIISYL